VPGDPPNFRLSDLGSSNGTLLNGERITGETELLPADTIELGAGGPKFVFDIEPRPSNLVARTRIINTPGSQATRVIDAAGTASGATAAPASTQAEPVTRSSIGRNTVMRLISEQHQATNRIGIYALAGVLVVIGLVTGALYYTNQSDVSDQVKQVAEQNAKVVGDQNAKLIEQAAIIQQQQKQIGLGAQQIADKYGNATVMVNIQWRLYDRETGKPLFHKAIEVPTQKGTIKIPCYVDMGEDKIYRWLTTEDADHLNYEVGETGAGSGFVVNDQGLIITNKHVAAGWLVNYNGVAAYELGQGLLFKAQAKLLPDKLFGKELKERMIFFDLTSNQGRFRQLASWQPEEGGPIFANNQPVVIGKGTRAFEGKIEELSVRFPGSRLDVSARLIRVSTDADAALIKIDATQSLSSVPLATDDNVKVGENVVVLGYPDFTAKNVAIVSTRENSEGRRRVEVIPQPTVITGNISNISVASQQVGNITVVGAMGNVYQLTVPSGPGNSGGPVFDPDGQVIGLYTYANSRREAVTYAVPIKYARDLMQMQRAL
jgi:serine protease Do